MTALARTFAVTPEIDCVCAQPVPGHAGGETFIATGVFTQAVHHRECDGGAPGWPGAIGKFRAVGGYDDISPDRGGLSRQDARTLSGF